MSLLSYTEICSLIRDNVIENADYEAVNSASLDLHVGNVWLFERNCECDNQVVRLNKKGRLNTTRVVAGVIRLGPGECVLAQTREVFNLPNTVSGEYKLKSSMARIFLEHLNAGWAAAGWNGSVLTLELKNVSQYHTIEINAGDAIGQMIFFSHASVPAEKSYAVRGSYNSDKEVSGVKVTGETGEGK